MPGKKRIGAANPVIQNLLNSNPWGPLPATGDGNETFTTPFLNNSDNVIAKVDKHLHLFSAGDLFTGRYFYSHGIQSFPLGMLYTGSSAPGYNTTTPTHINIASLSYTSIPRPNLIVEIRGGYNRFLQQFLPEDAGLNPETAFGLDTLSPDYSQHDLGLPTISVSGYSPIGSTSSDARGRVDTNYQLFGNVSLVKGRHSFKTGYEWRRTFINSFINSGHRGTLDFNSLSDFLSGTIDGGSSADGDGTRYSFQNNSGAYLLDSWRLSNKLTLNYGLRWDYYGVIGAKNNAFSIFNVKTSEVETIGASGGPSLLYPRDLLNFAPRVSMADDVLGNQKLVVRSSVGIYYDGPSQDFFVGNEAYNTSPSQQGPAFNTIGFASPAVATITSGTPIFGDTTNYSPNSLFSVEQNLRTPRYYSYGLNIESQLTPKIAVQIGYVGSEGRHLFRFRDINQAFNTPGSGNCGNGQSVTYGEQCFPAYVFINQIETSALSNYNSLQNTLKLQNLHGVTSTLNYTWAHSIDTASDGEDFVPNAAMPDNSWNPHAERASSNFDVRQRVQWYWKYALPNTKIRQAGWVVNGWALDGMFNFATGQPYTVSFFGDYNGSGEGLGRFDIVGNPHQGVGGVDPATGGVELLNMQAFAAPCPWDSVNQVCTGAGHPGNEGRNAFHAPNYTNMDFSLNKTSHITEKLAVELRADFFNLFNHPNLGNPLMPGFGVFVNPYPSSQFVETTATPDVATGNPYLGGGGPRSLQLAAHFNF